MTEPCSCGGGHPLLYGRDRCMPQYMRANQLRFALAHQLGLMPLEQAVVNARDLHLETVEPELMAEAEARLAARERATAGPACTTTTDDKYGDQLDLLGGSA